MSNKLCILVLSRNTLQFEDYILEVIVVGNPKPVITFCIANNIGISLHLALCTDAMSI